ncbi:hypothetical protein GCM10028822_00010 [Hymenobacter terrigena]
MKTTAEQKTFSSTRKLSEKPHSFELSRYRDCQRVRVGNQVASVFFSPVVTCQVVQREQKALSEEFERVLGAAQTLTVLKRAASCREALHFDWPALKQFLRERGVADKGHEAEAPDFTLADKAWIDKIDRSKLSWDNW